MPPKKGPRFSGTFLILLNRLPGFLNNRSVTGNLFVYSTAYPEQLSLGESRQPGYKYLISQINASEDAYDILGLVRSVIAIKNFEP